MPGMSYSGWQRLDHGKLGLRTLAFHCLRTIWKDILQIDAHWVGGRKRQCTCHGSGMGDGDLSRMGCCSADDGSLEKPWPDFNGFRLHAVELSDQR